MKFRIDFTLSAVKASIYMKFRIQFARYAENDGSLHRSRLRLTAPLARAALLRRTPHRGSLTSIGRKKHSPLGECLLSPSRGTLAALETPLNRPAGAGGLAPTNPPPGVLIPTWKRNKKAPLRVLFCYVPGGIRTPDRRLRRPLLYPAELLGHLKYEKHKQKILYHMRC
jgi:hypothetical protein